MGDSHTLNAGRGQDRASIVTVPTPLGYYATNLIFTHGTSEDSQLIFYMSSATYTRCYLPLNIRSVHSSGSTLWYNVPELYIKWVAAFHARLPCTEQAFSATLHHQGQYPTPEAISGLRVGNPLASSILHPTAVCIACRWG
jgi:hypothetical protein